MSYLRSLCRARYRQILYRHALTGIGHIGFFGTFFREGEGVDEAVMDPDPLRAMLVMFFFIDYSSSISTLLNCSTDCFTGFIRLFTKLYRNKCLFFTNSLLRIWSIFFHPSAEILYNPVDTVFRYVRTFRPCLRIEVRYFVPVCATPFTYSV